MCKDNQHEYKCGNAPIKISTRARHCVTEKTKALCLTGNFLSLPHFNIEKLSFYGELQSINTSYKYNKQGTEFSLCHLNSKLHIEGIYANSRELPMVEDRAQRGKGLRKEMEGSIRQISRPHVLCISASLGAPSQSQVTQLSKAEVSLCSLTKFLL